jgi:hypothetical protein
MTTKIFDAKKHKHEDIIDMELMKNVNPDSILYEILSRSSLKEFGYAKDLSEFMEIANKPRNIFKLAEKLKGKPTDGHCYVINKEEEHR